MAHLEVQLNPSDARPAPNAYAATFFEALELEPVASACIGALTNHSKRGSGLKSLRLVSKQANLIMLSAVRGYHLVIDGASNKEQPGANMMESIQVSRLVVEIEADSETNEIGSNHAKQMMSFITAAGTALHSVTTITLGHWPEAVAWDEIPAGHIAAVLSPLAQVCSLLQTLCVSGAVWPISVESFGRLCSGLRNLETDDVPLQFLISLKAFLPGITSTRMELFGQICEEPCGDIINSNYRLKNYQPVLSSWSTLRYLDAGGDFLSDETWQALPPSIQELKFPTPDSDGGLEFIGKGPPVGLNLPSLTKVFMYNHAMHVDELVRYLQALPHLQHITLSNAVIMPPTVDQIDSLVFIHSRIAAGLLFSAEASTMHRYGLVLSLKDVTDKDPENLGSRFVSKLPIFEHFVSLNLEKVQPSILVNLVRAFPRLRRLLIRGKFKSSKFPSLTVFPTLEVLEFCPNTTAVPYAVFEMGALCMQVPSLRHFNIMRLPPADHKSLVAVLKTWGRKIRVDRVR